MKGVRLVKARADDADEGASGRAVQMSVGLSGLLLALGKAGGPTGACSGGRVAPSEIAAILTARISPTALPIYGCAAAEAQAGRPRATPARACIKDAGVIGR